MGVTIKTYDWQNWPLFVQARQFIRDGGMVLDIGAGLRPQTLVRADEMACVEPHGPYADQLEAGGYAVIRGKAVDVLADCDPVDTVVMLDVLEHMDKAEGVRVLQLAQEVAKQVVVFTPLGFLPQEGDAWGMGGEEWQRHRSGWLPKEFQGWNTVVDQRFHDHLKAGAFIAVWHA